MTVNKHSVDWETEIKEYDNWNKTMIEFLVNKPYSRSSFYKHLKKEVNHLNFSKPEPVNFLPVICSQSKDITSDTISVNGYELSFNKDTDEKILKKLLGVLKDL